MQSYDDFHLQPRNFPITSPTYSDTHPKRRQIGQTPSKLVVSQCFSILFSLISQNLCTFAIKYRLIVVTRRCYGRELEQLLRAAVRAVLDYVQDSYRGFSYRQECDVKRYMNTFTTRRFEDHRMVDDSNFIDGRIRSTKVLIEQKSLGKDLRAGIRQSDNSLLNPFQQACGSN